MIEVGSLDVDRMVEMRAEHIYFNDSVDLLVDIIDASKEITDTMSFLDRIAWIARCAFLAGYRDALQNMTELLQE